MQLPLLFAMRRDDQRLAFGDPRSVCSATFVFSFSSFTIWANCLKLGFPASATVPLAPLRSDQKTRKRVGCSLTHKLVHQAFARRHKYSALSHAIQCDGDLFFVAARYSIGNNVDPIAVRYTVYCRLEDADMGLAQKTSEYPFIVKIGRKDLDAHEHDIREACSG